MTEIYLTISLSTHNGMTHLRNIQSNYPSAGSVRRKTPSTEILINFNRSFISITDLQFFYIFSLSKFSLNIIIIIIFLHGLGRLTCSGIDAFPSFPGASTISSSSVFVVEDVFRESVVVHSLKVVYPILFLFGSYILYSRDL